MKTIHGFIMIYDGFPQSKNAIRKTKPQQYEQNRTTSNDYQCTLSAKLICDKFWSTASIKTCPNKSKYMAIWTKSTASNDNYQMRNKNGKWICKNCW